MMEERAELEEQLRATRKREAIAEGLRQQEVAHGAEPDKDEAGWSEQCARAVWSAFEASAKPEQSSAKVVLAGFVLRELASMPPRVIALGTGTQCVSGDKFSLEGRVVHDCHAEIVARRGLLRWLYSQLSKARSGEDSVFTVCTTGRVPYELRSTITLWLYVSLAPCGDSAIFSRSDPQPSSSGAIWTTQKHGMFRTKQEAGQGTVPVAGKVQTLDGLQRGERALSHSCSDKLAKWAAVGVQGALLSRLMEPLYLSGIVVTDVFSHGHLCRALCCRSQRALDTGSDALPFKYRLQHLQVRHAMMPKPRHQQIKKYSSTSMNWAEPDGIGNAEFADGSTGLRTDGMPTKICKMALFAAFCRLHPPGASYTYALNKEQSQEYQQAKRSWLEAMSRSLYGEWICKPAEISDFCCVSSRCLSADLSEAGS